uniref:Uncharacterized protein n=1 Tax=Arundo donax TaxID=35708 RepID=A0A0A9AGQ4_ARUDO
MLQTLSRSVAEGLSDMFHGLRTWDH